MPDELTDEELAEMKALLISIRDELQQTMLRSADHSAVVELDQTAVGRLSRMDAIQQQQMADAQKRRNELRLQQIAVALSGFATDDYGFCKKCGEPIDPRRLRARPESPCCVPCMASLGR